MTLLLALVRCQHQYNLLYVCSIELQPTGNEPYEKKGAAEQSLFESKNNSSMNKKGISLKTGKKERTFEREKRNVYIQVTVHVGISDI